VSLLLVVGAAVLVCFGGLLGASWTFQVMGGVSRRHAAERRSLNDGWRALEDAKRARGERVYCARCYRTLSDASWLAIPVLTDEEDDGT
jgi:hypothetical protein